ncbi:LuxR family transcriptional regulator [Slackia exigua]|uniref:LuxR family transcriptional regulator n=1 Tax=Slackia exigua TaxID=84109 RepID=UPI003B9E1362
MRNHACDASRVRGARLLSMFGLACYIAWSFLFWNGPLLMIGPWDAAGASVAFMVQGIATVVASVLIAGIALRSPSAFLRFAAFALFCGLSISAVVLLALSCGDESVQQLSIAFALSGAGSTLRLLWEERISLGGVRTVALTVAATYVLGYVLFVACALLASEAVIVALAFFGYGAMRTTGVIGGYAAGGVLSSALSAGVPALASLIAVLLAYCLHQKNASLTLYVAFPLMVIAALIPPELDPFSGGGAFCIALVGSETIKYVVWFMLVRSFAQDQVSALFILAILRCAQWLGSVAGQSASLVAPTGQTLSIVVLLALMMALLLAVGLPSRGFSSTPEASVQDRAKPRDHVALAVQKLAVFEHAFDVQLAAFARRRAESCDLAALRDLGRAAVRRARAQTQACASGCRDHAP